MTVSRLILVTLMAALATFGLSQGYGYDAVTPEAFDWQDVPLVQGMRSANLLGDGNRAELYTSVGEIPAGAVFPGHTHPDDRFTIVVSGTMYFGVGDSLEEVEFIPYPAGSVVHTPAGVPHFMWAKDGGVTVQEVGFGPTGATFLEAP